MSVNINYSIQWVKFYNILLIFSGAYLPSVLIVNGFRQVLEL